MPLLGKFSRGSSTNTQTQAAQVPNGYHSTSRGPKPPTTGPAFVSSTSGSAQATPSAQGTTNPLNVKYPRKSSRSPSFFPILPRRMSPQTQPTHGTSSQPTATSQTQAVPFVTQPPKSSSSNNVPILETRSAEVPRPSGTNSTWRNLFSRSASRDRDKPPVNGAGSAARPSTPSRAPSPESLLAGPNMTRQLLPVNRVFEGVHETKSVAVRPAYASSGSKSSLTSGSLPSLVAESTPKSTTRAQTRADALAALPPVPGATSVPANGSSQALAPPVKDPPAPPPPPPPSVASEAFPQSNARLAVASATSHHRKEYISPRSGSPTHHKSGLRNAAQSSPHYVAAQPQSITQVSVSPPLQQQLVTRTTDSGSRDRRRSTAEHVPRKMEITPSSSPQQALVSTRGSANTATRARNTSVAENPLALVARGSAVSVKGPLGSTPPNRTYSNPPSESRALTTTQVLARHRYDSAKSRLQVVTSHTLDEDDDDLDDLLTPSSLASGHGWDPTSFVPSKVSKPRPKLLEAAPAVSAEPVMAMVRKPEAVSSSLMVLGGPRRLRTDSMASSITSSSVSSEVVIAAPLPLIPRSGSATVVPSPATSAFPPMITREESAAVPELISLELAPRSTARPLQRRTSTPDSEGDKRRAEIVALVRYEKPSTIQSATAINEPPRGILAIEPAPAQMGDAASGQVVIAKAARSTAVQNPPAVTAVAGKAQTMIRKLEDNSSNQLSPRLIKNTSTERVGNSRGVIVGAAKPLARNEEQSMEIIRLTQTVGRRPSKDIALMTRPSANGQLETQSSNSAVALGLQEHFAPSRSHPAGGKPPIREIEAPAQDSSEAGVVARRGSKEVTTMDPPQKKKLDLTSTSNTWLDGALQTNVLHAPVLGESMQPAEGVNGVSRTTQTVTRRPSREVTIGSKAQAQTSSDALVTRPSQQGRESRSLAVAVTKGTPQVEASIKEAPPKPPVVRRPSRDAPTDSSPARGVTESVKAIASEERPTTGNRTLAQRAPRRLSITVPKPPALNTILSPISSEASQPVVHSIQALKPSPPVASPAPPPVLPQVIEPAPKATTMESAIVPLPATPSMLPAPPPTPQAELALARARAAADLRSTAKAENRKEAPALTTGLSDNENTTERALLQPPARLALKARSPSPLTQELSTAATEKHQVVATGLISSSGLQVDTLTSALSPANATTPVGPLAVVPTTGRIPDGQKSSNDKTHHAAKPPTSGNRNASEREASAPRNPRRRIESTPSRGSRPSPAPLEAHGKSSTRSNTLEDFTARLAEPFSHIKPALAITQSSSGGEGKQTDQLSPASQNNRPSGLSSTRPPEQKRNNDSPPSHSMPSQESNLTHKTRTPSPTNDPPVGARRGRTSPVPIPPPPEFRPPQDSSPPRGILGNPSATNSPSFSTSPPPPSGVVGRQKPAWASTLPTPSPSSNNSIPRSSQSPPGPTINTSASALTGRVWRSRRSGAPSALNALSPSSNAATPSPIPRGAPLYATQRPSTPRSGSPPRLDTRSRDPSMSSSSSPSWDLFASYSSAREREARLEKAQREFEEEKGRDIIPAAATKPPQPFIALNIPLAKKNSPFAFLSRGRHVRTLSSASVDGAGGSQAMGSIADAASRRSGFSDFTPPPSPPALENVIYQWHDALDGQKKRKPGVTWDIDTGSPVASFSRLMNLEGHTDTEEGA